MSEQEKTEEKYNIDDSPFKNIIHDSRLLPRLLQGSIDELREKTPEEIMSCLELTSDGRRVIGRRTEFDSASSGTIRLDSVFTITIPGTDEDIGIIVNIEGQNRSKPRYPLEKRAEYYMARLVSAQKGVFFTSDDYGKLRKVYSVWYILNPNSENRNTAVSYSMQPKMIAERPGMKIPLLDTFNIMLVNVGRYDSNLSDDMAYSSVLFSNLSLEERKDLLMDRFNIEMDDIMRQEFSEIMPYGEDTFNNGYDAGIDAERSRSIDAFSDTITFLVRDKGWPIDEALSLPSIPKDLKDRVKEEALKKLD